MKAYENLKELYADGYWVMVYNPYGKTFKRNDDEITFSGKVDHINTDSVLIDGEEMQARRLSATETCWLGT